jgi:predicted PurR-regulated permease PerM
MSEFRPDTAAGPAPGAPEPIPAAPPGLDARSPVEIAVEAAIRIGVIAALLFVCYRIVEPFLPPIAWGVIIAVASWPGYQRLSGRLGGRRVLASVLFCVIALLLLLVPVALLSETLVQGAQWLTHGVEEGDFRIPPPPDLSNVPLVGDDVEAFWQEASTNLTEVLRKFQPQLQMLGSWLLHFAASAGVGLVHFVLAIVIAAVLLANSGTGRQVADAISWRLAGARGIRFARLAEAVVRSVSRGILGVALVQALLAGLGMLAAGVPAAGLWALVVLILATIQVGAFPVMLPAMIYLFYTADLTTAVLFAAWTLFVGSIDNVLKPILLGRGVSVPMAVIFVGAIGGFIGSGIIGLFVGAVVLALGYELFRAWLEESVPPVPGADGPAAVAHEGRGDPR